MSAEVWGVVAAFAGVGAAFLAVFVAALSGLKTLKTAIQRSSADNRAEMRELRTGLRAEIRAKLRQEAQERRADMQRFFDALYRHRHESGGSIYVPESGD